MIDKINYPYKPSVQTMEVPTSFSRRTSLACQTMSQHSIWQFTVIDNV